MDRSFGARSWSARSFEESGLAIGVLKQLLRKAQESILVVRVKRLGREYCGGVNDSHREAKDALRALQRERAAPAAHRAQIWGEL